MAKKPGVEKIFTPGGEFIRISDQEPPKKAPGDLSRWSPVPQDFPEGVGLDPWAIGTRAVAYLKRRISRETVEWLRRAPKEINEEVGDPW